MAPRRKPIGRLHVLTDVELQTRFSHVELTRLAIDGGADTVQFRQKTGSTRALIETAREMGQLCARAGVTFLVNDRVDVAIAADADGVHLGQSDFPIPLARRLLGPGRIVGGSASTVDEAKQCEAEGADYVGFGPVYPTTSKADAAPAGGLDLLLRVVEAVACPVVAIGGIGEGNAAAVLRAGALGIAVISAVCCRDDPAQAARGLARVLAGAGGSRG
ncbi:MAG: thiamine phosphate synthase [Deltaproteobacteria bacterium]|nr:thiamine phosphate synthase [Deltaproteobacteria bacterium]